VEHHGPVLPRHKAGAALHPRGFTREEPRPGLGAAIHVRSGLGGMMQHLQHAGVGQWPPEERSALAFPPAAGGETEVMDGAMLDNGQGRPIRCKEGEEEPDRLRHCLVGIEDHLAGRIAHETRRWPEAPCPVVGLVQLAAQQAAAQPVPLGCAHRPLEAQQQAVIGLAGVIDPLFINDERVGQRAHFEQSIPITRGAGQPGDLQTEDGACMPQADLGNEGLEAIASSSGGTGVPLIVVDDGEGLLRPPQVAGALREIVLPRGAGGVFAHLEEGGLPDRDAGLPLQRRGADLRRCDGEEPTPPPAKTAQGRTVGIGPRPS